MHALHPRQAASSDRELLLELIRAYYAFDHIAFFEEPMREGLTRFLADPTLGRAYLFEVESRVAGYCLFTFGFDLEFGGRLALLTDLYLVPERRGQGGGRAALQFLEQLLPTLGVSSFELQVERGNEPARRLYRGYGFRELDRIPMSKALGENR